MKPLSVTPPATWKQRYETVRQHSLEGPSVLATAPLGWVLLCRQGVAGWMHHWHEDAGSSKVCAPCPGRRPTALESGPQQLIHLLAQITMTHLFN